jgi:uncharacterized protein YqjF (DUF2071 family)
MPQIWRNLTFLHWRYDPEIIRRTIPPQLTLDTFDGSAWIGLVPFALAIPGISKFPETNVRTYVLGPGGEPGVWFHTLEASSLLAVLAARAWYKLPYRWADMSVTVGNQSIEYRSARKAPFGKGVTDVAIEIGDPHEAGDLDNFLTARYRLYTFHKGRIAFAQIQHDPWPLQHGRVLRLNEDLIQNSGVPAPKGEPLVHFSRQLRVKAGPPRWL